MAPDRLEREKLQVGNRLAGTRSEGTRLEGNRPGNQQQTQLQMQQQKWQQQLQQQQRQNQVGGGEEDAGRYPEPGESGKPERKWSACDQTGHSRRRGRRQSGDDAPPW